MNDLKNMYSEEYIKEEEIREVIDFSDIKSLEEFDKIMSDSSKVIRF